MNALSITNKPLVFNYQQDNYEKWVTDFSKLIETNTVTTKIKYPCSFGTDYGKGKIIEPGLSYRIVDYTLNTDIQYQSYASKNFTLSIYFYELNFSTPLYCKIGQTVIECTDKFYSAALLTTSFTAQILKLAKDTHIRGVSVQIDEEWLEKNIKDFTAAKLELFKQKDCVLHSITAKQRKILYDILYYKNDTALPELFVKSRVLRLTEQLLTSLCNKEVNNEAAFNNPKDFQALIKVEQLLLNQVATGFPSIQKLAKTALMSESKLKKLFKNAYGMAIYQYYQKNRMHKAKTMLSADKLSVTQVGIQLGYKNMSNFSAAFKKEFSCVPSQFKEII